MTAPKNPATFALKGTGVALTFAALFLFLLAIAPLIVMLGTGWLNDSVPQVPALSFWQSVVACIVGRALTYSSSGTSSRA